ncbi:hypothetical protein ACERZ8_13540 [Tateyamaria armeniaca]|uniref:Uncharacterized protein n=1 Tax=Tateyamaria armeniaca TaxID=2518930 RepID=A0ABW8UUU4_9RHOB
MWFDEAAVPRFEPFSPQQTANIYAYEAVLVRIECQGCQHPFDVAFTSTAASKPLPKVERADRSYPLLRDYIRAGQLHYGDPPNIECCAAGASMNSVPRQVLEYWVKPYVLGEGVCSSWPRRAMPEDPTKWIKPSRVILAPDAMHFRRERDLETYDLTPDWAR